MPINDEAAARSGESVGFSFGDNWRRFLDRVDDRSLTQAKESLSASFRGEDLAGQAFLDIGCGSGIFSLAARRMGAHVTSVDVDPASVACAERLRGDDPHWCVMQQSILRPEGLPRAARVYSWGVLHHTGAMWEAVNNALSLVEPGGRACIALYNRPHFPRTQLWLKRRYNRSGQLSRRLMVAMYGAVWLTLGTIARRRNPVRYVRRYGGEARGMSFWRDVEDWMGGLPFEYTEPSEFERRLPPGYALEAVLVRRPGACNEYLVGRCV